MAAAAWAILAGAGCKSSGGDLVIDLRTDVVPGQEFIGIRTRLFSSAEEAHRAEAPLQTLDAIADEAIDYTAGVRLAEIGDLRQGHLAIRVDLLGPGGAEVATRIVLVTISGTVGVTVLISRRCSGVECPASGDDPSWVTCLAGRCVDPRCSPETPEHCPTPECEDDSGCPPPTDCTTDRCAGGVCLTSVDPAMCGPGERCTLDGGCVAPTPPTPATLAAGELYSCAVLGGHVLCWGDNTSGQLGDGSTDSRTVPTEAPGLADAVEVAAGAGAHTCALRATGEVVCWGDNGVGQLGDGTRDPALSPVTVPGVSSATQVVVGASHTCARIDTGDALCWGGNDVGQLGRGMMSEAELTPAAVMVPDGAFVVSLAAAADHTCAVLASGAVACWGKNVSGELGRDTGRMPSATPMPVAGLLAVDEVDVGFGWTCARSGSSVRCFGSNGCGQLGLGDRDAGAPFSTFSPLPVVGIPDVAAFAAGTECHSCAVTGSQQLYCFGDNNCGQLGLDRMAVPSADVPQPVPLPEGVAEVALGGQHTCVRTAGDVVECFGRNAEGQLGDGMTSDVCVIPE